MAPQFSQYGGACPLRIHLSRRAWICLCLRAPVPLRILPSSATTIGAGVSAAEKSLIGCDQEFECWRGGCECMTGSLAETPFISCSSSLCDIGAGANGLGPCRALAREEGLDPDTLAGARGSGGADSLEVWSTTKQPFWFSGTGGALAGELARTAGRTVCLLEIAVVQSSKGVPRSSSKRSSIPALMKPESGSVPRGGRFGLDRVGNPPSRTGGEEGMVNECSNRPW